MAKDEVTDYDVVDANNTDIHGYPTDGAQPPKNIKYWTPAFMGAIARMLSGATVIKDTLKWRAIGDATKTYRIRATNIPAGNNRDLDVEALYRQGAPLETMYTSSGTHTFAAKTRFFSVEAVGGGGGGGGVDGQGTGKLAAASGGSSGYYGITGLLGKGSLTAATVTIGAAGTGASSGANTGTVGGNTIWDDGTNLFRWGGGKGGIGITADTGTAGVAPVPARATPLGTLYGTSDINTFGFATSAPSGSSAPGVAYGGPGGQCPFGTGGDPGSASAGVNAIGYGAGGGGAGVSDTSTNYGGGNGGPGLLIVREW